MERYQKNGTSSNVASSYPEVVTQSYGNFCEKIIVKSPNLSSSNSKIDLSFNHKTSKIQQSETVTKSSASIFLNSPVNPQGSLYDLSDRPILCSSQFRDEVVFGCSDHAAYAVKLTAPLSRGKDHKTNQNLSSASSSSISSSSSFTTLYGKTYGHTDWVTGIAHATDGRVITGGMDSRLCLWSHNKRSCSSLEDHDMSIAKLMSIHPLNIVVSLGYDKKVNVWRLPTSEEHPKTSYDSEFKRSIVSSKIWSPLSKMITSIKSSDVLLGHIDPVLECAVVSVNGVSDSSTGSPSVATACAVATGDRTGTLKVWDICAGRALVTYSQSQDNHGGSVTALTSPCSTLQEQFASTGYTDFSITSQNNYFMSGAADGCVSVWDVRQGSKPAYNLPVHVSATESLTNRSDRQQPTPSVSSRHTPLPQNSSSSTMKKSLKPSRLVASQANSGVISPQNTIPTPSVASSLKKLSGTPVTCLSALVDKSGYDMRFLLSGGADGRLVLLDLRMTSGRANNSVVAEYNKHINGVHSLHVMDDNKVVYSGDGSGMLFSHHLNIASTESCTTNSRETSIDNKFGLGVSSQGAVKCIHHVHSLDGKEGRLIAAGDDGKAILYDYA